jgi:hypothetical protein
MENGLQIGGEQITAQPSLAISDEMSLSDLCGACKMGVFIRNLKRGDDKGAAEYGQKRKKCEQNGKRAVGQSGG